MSTSLDSSAVRLVRLGRLGGGGCRAVAVHLDLAEDLADLHGRVGLGQDLDQRPRGGGRHLGVDLVGGHLHQRLVGLHPVADLLQPPEDGAFRDRLAHLGHADLHGRRASGHPKVKGNADVRGFAECSSGGASSGAGATRISRSRETTSSEIGRGAREHLGFEPVDVERPPAAGGLGAPAAPARAAAGAGVDLQQRALRARHPRLRQGLPRPGAGPARPLRQPARRGRLPAPTRPSSSACSNGAPRPARRRSPTAAAPAWSAESSRACEQPAAVTIDLGRLDRVLEVDPVSRAARIQAGAHGPARWRSSCKRARADAAPLPAVVRVLDARRLDRHPRRRPLRHAPHAHRRLRRVGAGAHARAAPGRAGACRARARVRAPTGC